jgi:acylphosphatase
VTLIRATLRITGRVQGVFYRESARREAELHHLTGWIRNDPDGAVRAVAEGTRDAINAFVGWCKKGPPAARVTSVDVNETVGTGEFARFLVTR